MKVQDIAFKTPEHVIQEVRDMNVKGGSPFGRAAAWAVRLACEQEKFDDISALRTRLNNIADQLVMLKPTMATIANTQLLVNQRLGEMPADATAEIAAEAVIEMCKRIIEHSYTSVSRLGKIGANLITEGAVVMMHSYSSTLMSVFEAAVEKGTNFSVICTESRPLRESRLAAKVLSDLGVPVIYITDAEIWEFMPTVDMIIMGVDSLAWDGSVANKMGSAMITQLAQVCKKRVYFASELFKLDSRTAEGRPILLERRTETEVIAADDFDGKSGIEVINQFFDLTPANQITGLITEYGVIAPQMVSVGWEKFKNELFY